MTGQWGRAGVRLQPYRGRKRSPERDVEGLRLARREWAAGMVIPYAITLALDCEDLFGPEVDHACGVQEPAVDLWEAGRLYPSWEQLCALAELTSRAVRWFTVSSPMLSPWDTSMRFHVKPGEALTPPKLRFADHVVRACVGTDRYVEIRRT